MITSEKIVVQLIVEQCIANGMKHIVCSPGSRNAPLVIAFDEHPEVECLVIHDERSAAFFALGMAQQLNAPVGVLCTSGSAAANYYPSVTEAYYQCIPLVVLTADRPAEWIDQGDGQTIVQKNIYGNHVRYSCDFNEGQSDQDGLWFVGRELAIAFAEANAEWKGPIHINIGLNEPLYNTKVRENLHPRVLQKVKGAFQLTAEDKRNLSRTLETPKKLIIVGQYSPDKEFLKELIHFASDSSVAVLVENTANVFNERFVHCIDRTLNSISEEEIMDFAPELLITVGGAVISKRIKSFLRTNKPLQHWKVGCEFPYMDTYQCLTHSFITNGAEFFKELNHLDYKRNSSNYGAAWKQKDILSKDKMPAFFKTVEYSDIKVFETILDYIPDGANIHMSNSSVIRYCQLFDPVTSFKYWSNRGTSGIDGSTSTAAGAAYIRNNELNVLITGDISFFYDSNALWNKYLGSNLRIFLINNQGGGIFRIIPGPSTTPQLTTYFEAQHAQEAGDLCRAFNVEYFKSDSIATIEHQLAEFFAFEDEGKPKLMEIITPGDLNESCLAEFFRVLK